MSEKQFCFYVKALLFALFLPFFACEPPGTIKQQQKDLQSEKESASLQQSQPVASTVNNPVQQQQFASASQPTALSESELMFLFYPNTPQQAQILNKISVLNDKAHIPMLIDFVQHFKQNTPQSILDTLSKLSGENFQKDWYAWRKWQQQNHFEANSLYILFKTYLFQQYDPDYLAYIRPGLLHTIPLEDVHFAEINQFSNPTLYNPAFVAADLSELADDEPVIGIAFNSVQKAIPLKYFEVNLAVNDKIAGTGYSLTYCPYSGSPACFVTDLGTSGNLTMSHLSLYRKGNLIFSTPANQSLWQNLGNKAVIGSMVHYDIALDRIPVTRSSWGSWKKGNPETLVMLKPAFSSIVYPQEQQYKTYENSPLPKFPVALKNESLKAKEWVCGLYSDESSKAWGLDLFEENPVLNTSFNGQPIVIIADSNEKSVRIYRRGEIEFNFTPEQKLVDKNSSEQWNLTEEGLVSSNGGTKLERIPNSLCYWFAWQAIYPNTELEKQDTE